MQDAKSCLLVVGAAGNAAAEAAGGPPCLTLTVHPPAGTGEPRLEVQSKTAGFTASLADADVAGEAVADPPQADDVALFLHTSGTTSRPKGVPLTHANLAASLGNIVQVCVLGGRGGGGGAWGRAGGGALETNGGSCAGADARARAGTTCRHAAVQPRH